MSIPAEDDKIDWLSAGAAIASISVVGICIGLGMPLLSVILEQRGYSATMIGLNTAFAGLASIGAAPFAAPLASRLGVVPAMITMIILGGFSFAGFYLFEPFWAWLLLRCSLHFALTVLFILSEYWISHAAPSRYRGLMLGIYATMLSLGFALGPYIFSLTGSKGFLPFGLACAIISLAIVPVVVAWRHSPDFEDEEHVPFLPYVLKVPTATAAVLVYGAVETGGFALLPLYGSRIGYSEGDTALLMTMIGIGNVVFQIPIGMLSDRVKDRRWVLLTIAAFGLAGMIAMPYLASSWGLLAGLLFIWGGMIAGLYTVGLAHLGSKLSGRELASANAAFIFCYAIGMLVGPQAIGFGMDLAGPQGFAGVLAGFFAGYLLLAISRIAFSNKRG
jgi:MFS family permease